MMFDETTITRDIEIVSPSPVGGVDIDISVTHPNQEVASEICTAITEAMDEAIETEIDERREADDA